MKSRFTSQKKSYLVTGGSGFIGAALTKRLVHNGHRVRVLDDNSRGSLARLHDIAGDYEFIEGDIRDPQTVVRASSGMDGVCHLAFVNGTEFFYSKPEMVLEIGVKGIVNVIDACLTNDIGELILASSSEVYSQPPEVPTGEEAPLVVPDPLNPRYSYGGSKIISELMALNYGRKHFERVLIFRPHNVYGPNMGWEHVLPQFVIRAKAACAASPSGVVAFPLQGSGAETRAFVHIDDMIDGLEIIIERGEHLGIYHIGAADEITIAEVAHLVAAFFGRRFELQPGDLQPGGTLRRCPDISKLAGLGYRPKIPLAEGLPELARWYVDNPPPA